MSKHTPGPWETGRTGPTMRDNYSQPFCILQTGEPNLIAGVFGDVRGGDAVAEANAKYIARACNLHDDLITVLKAVLACKHCLDEDGHAYLKVPARSLNDLGATISAIVSEAEGV